MLSFCDIKYGELGGWKTQGIYQIISKPVCVNTACATVMYFLLKYSLKKTIYLSNKRTYLLRVHAEY